MMNAKKKRVIIILAILLLLIIITVVGGLYFAKPSKVKLVTGLDDAFEYYRSGGIVSPPVSFYPDAYQQQYWFVDGHWLTMREYMLLEENKSYRNREALSHFDALPSGLIVPDVITVNDFMIKRPSREVLVIIKLNGFEAHCVMQYMSPFVMERFPRPDWQVVSVTFIADTY